MRTLIPRAACEWAVSLATRCARPGAEGARPPRCSRCRSRGSRGSRRSRCLGVSQWQRMVGGLSAGRRAAVGAGRRAGAAARRRVRPRAGALALARDDRRGAGRAAGRLLRRAGRSRCCSRAGSTSWARARRAASQALRPCGCPTTAPTRGRRWCCSCSARACDDRRAARVLAARRRHRAATRSSRSPSLLVLIASPVVSLGGTRPLLLGSALTVLTVCFLWLERLPLRPGLGVAALLGLALAGALPLAAAADRGEPWFDYQAFAEGLGPKDPVRFDWGHGDYGPISWGRTGAEVVRVKATRPAYWKVRTLDEFDGNGWIMGGYDRASDDPTLDLPANWQTRRASRTASRSPSSACAAPTWSAPGRRSTCSTRAAGSSPASRRASGSRSASCARATPTPRASTCRARPPTSSPRCPRPRSTEHMEDLARAGAPARRPLAGRARRAARRRAAEPARREPARQRHVSFPPFGRVGAPAVRRLPRLRTTGDGATALQLSDYRAPTRSRSG